MARQVDRLTAIAVSATKKPGMYPDGRGLYLQVTSATAKSWIFRYSLHGRAREMGLGPHPTIGLADARSKATDCRRLLVAGIDPIEHRRAEREAARLEANRQIDFETAAKAYIAAHRHGWKNPKHADQWEATLRIYVYPVFGSRSVQEIEVGHVLQVIEPIWHKKTETASRVRGRIEAVLDWSTARGYRRGDNPARWKGHVEILLPKRSKVRKVKHQPAMKYVEASAFMHSLQKRAGISSLAMQFLILTAARTGAVINARWAEIDVKARVWNVPDEQGRKLTAPHRVPLSPPALAILELLHRDRLEPLSPADHVFPGGSKGGGLSCNALLALLKRMGRDDITSHGFRSTFREWAAELTVFPREIAETALAHTIRDKVEAAYMRSDLFEKRRLLMSAWADFCTSASTPQVLPMRASA